jgi:predicted TIM-barrel fold metal-dependent hydrolase
VMFATDFPFLPFDRAVDAARALDLRPGVAEKYLRDNARRVFRFPPASAPPREARQD